ncbi:DNA-binding protein [Prevotella sp. MA2016]|uniref:HU family DNA-binding protein n=1 Tax=Prevotella sp. MA2016 TaxID=1408310 RepID=UPI00055BAC82|nr:DNA-binding protein [Prevotella sp. MA2016]
MVRYILQQIKINGHKYFGGWFAKNVVEETIDLDGLAEHMSNHNSPYSKGVIKGLLTDMISCIKELLLEGKNVKVDDLAIFSLGIKNKVMALKEEDFTVSKNISGVKLKARATGDLMSKNLNLEATLKRASLLAPGTSPDPGTSPNPSQGGEQGGGQPSGSQTGGGQPSQGGNTAGDDNDPIDEPNGD